jgi:hypothetical protein
VTCAEENDLIVVNVCREAPHLAGLSCFRRWNVSAFAVPDLARHYGVAPGTIGRWCSEDRIEGRRDPHNQRRKLYPLQRVQDAYDKRHEQA